ncbi:MAG: fibronectin type III domain-containing protein [Desulfobacterales bacterium]
MLKFRLVLLVWLKSGRIFSRTQSSVTSTKIGVWIGRQCLALVWVAAVLPLYMVALPAAQAETVTLAWDANEEPDLEGYMVHRNTGSPGPPYSYSDEVPEEELVDPLHPQVQLTDLQEGEEYYIALTAYNAEGVESDFSNDVCIEVVDGAIDLCEQSASPSVSTDSSSGDGGGGGGGACFIATASTKASYFSQWIDRPIMGSPVQAMLFMLLVLVVAVKRVSANSKKIFNH